MSDFDDDELRRALWEAGGDGCDTDAALRHVEARVRRIRRRRMDVGAVAVLSAILVTLGLASRSNGHEPAQQPPSVETATTAPPAIPTTAMPRPPDPTAPPDVAGFPAPAAEAVPEDAPSAVEPPSDGVVPEAAGAPGEPPVPAESPSAPARTPASAPANPGSVDRSPTPAVGDDQHHRRPPSTTATTEPDRSGPHHRRFGDVRDGWSRR